MRTDTQLWREKNLATSKDPRYTIELAFDAANTILAYFTSHTDCATPGGGTLISGVVEGISGTSQGLDPDKGVATIGAISFRVIDKASAVTTQLGNQITLGRSTRQQRVRVYMGFEGLAFADYTLVATQIVDDIGFDDGVYTFRCADIQRAMRKDIFDLATTTLAASISDTDTTVQVYDTSKFAMLAHGTSYSDAPSSTVGYFKLDDEAIRYTGKTATTFTGCTRGVLNTRAAAHVIDPGASADRQPKVEEYVYLEMPAPKLAYALLTGVLHGQGGATLPSGWHLGISIDYAKLADFTGIGADLWDTADDDEGFVVYFEALAKQDGKQFIEKELMVLMGTYMPVYNDGRLGLRRMANILAGAAYVQLLDESNVVSHGELQHDFKSLHNQIQIDWNYEPAEKRFTRTTALIDQDSITIHKAGEPLKLAFRGLHGSRHSATILKQRFDALRDRYTGPPLRMTEKALPSLNAIEVGDVVRNKLSTVRDFVANGTLDRSFEVQKISIDWVRGDVSLTLFASSQAPGAIAPTADASVLPQSWYEARGTALSTALTITGSNPGHISANGNLVAGDYYYIGDLVLDAGVTVTLNGTVRLFVMGHLTINGDFDGKGRGLAGAAQVAAFANPYINETRADYATRIGSHNDGTVGYLGSPRSGGGIVLSGRVRPLYDGYLTQGANPTVPSFAIAWDGAALSGLPADLRGSSGATGHNSSIATSGYDESFGSQYSSISYARGGAGGAGGAGLVTVTRGVSFGGSGGIDLSGADGTLGEHVDYFTRLLYAGAGAGGAPGGWLCVLDGALANVPSLGVTFVADYGRAPIAGNLVTKSIKVGNLPDGASVSHLVGNGDGTTFPLPSLSGARGGARIQFVPANVAAEADPVSQTLTPPSSLTLESGTSELLALRDGTVVPRIKLTWQSSADARTRGYDIQFKETSASIWQNAPVVLGVDSATTWIVGVRDNVAHDVRLRAAGDVRLVSDWLTVTNYTVVGKTEAPTAVGALSFDGVFLTWEPIADRDRLGYVVRVGDTTVWDTAASGHGAEYITDARFDTRDLVGGQKYLLVKSIDYTRVLSGAAASLLVDLRPPTPTQFTVTRQPDGTRQFQFALSPEPDDLAGYKIRYYLGTTSDWSAMTPLHDGLLLASPFESNLLAAGTYTFACKSEDGAGNESASPLFITTTIGDPRIAGAIEDIVEEPTWSGTKTNCHADAATGWLIASNNGSFNTIPATWDAWAYWIDDPYGSITYEILIDVGLVVQFVPLVTVTGDGTMTVEEAHSNDNVSYSSFAVLGPVVTARYIKIRVTVTGSFPKLKSMRSILSASPITETIEDLNTSTLGACSPSPSCSTSGYRIAAGDIRLPIVKSYAVIKAVALTLQNVGAGWTWELIDKDTNVGPRVKIYNASGTLADATIDADIKGL